MGKFRVDIDLQKIQILSDHYEAIFNLKWVTTTSVIFGILIGLVILYLQKAISDLQYFSSVLVYGIALYIILKPIKRDYDKGMDILDSLMKKVEKGESLSSLDELRKMKKNQVVG